jgi:Cd2+/Zn2+-exporting ATPase
MSESTLQLQLPVLLPHVEDERDQCVARLNEQIAAQKGIEKAHLERAAADGPTLVCLHYDPNLLTLERVQRIAEQAGAHVTKRYCHETLHVTGMECADCARSIEHILGRAPGVLAASVSYAAEKVRLEYDTTVTSHAELVRRIGWLGYAVQERTRPSWVQAHEDLLLPAASGVLLAAAFIGQRVLGLPVLAAIVLYLLSYAAGGYEAAWHGVKAALKLRFEVDFLMVAAALGAALLGDWVEGGLLLFLFSLGHGLEHYAMDRARHAVEALGELAPRSARVRRSVGGVWAERELPVEELERGDVVIVRAGERLPVDGTVRAGQSAVDQSAITGESMPVAKEPGAEVFAGTVNGDGALEIEVTRLAQDSTLARVMQMVEEAETQKSPTQMLTERFTRVFVPAALALVVLTIFVPPLAGWLDWRTSFLRAMTILVAASPCALAIATPATILAGVAQAARQGVLIKGGMHLENLGRIDTLAFDKTGTITSGKPQVTDVIALDGTGPAAVLALAAAVESRSAHPLAQAIGAHASAQKLTLPAVEDVQSLNGRGLRATLGGEPVQVGSLKLFEDGGLLDGAVAEAARARTAALEAEGKTVVVVGQGDRPIGVIGVADRPRPNAQAALAQLRGLGITRLVMLTGDNTRVAAAVASQVGLTEVRAGLLPADKLQAIRALAGQHGRVAMVGDGVNDAPALATATVGIAMGAGGSGVALETADVALMADDLSRLPFAVGLSRQANRVMRQNLAIALGMIALLIPVALLGVAGIGPAIVLHEGSTVAVVLNALRLLGYRQA